MRIATWNVNSVGARLPRLNEWLELAAPDVLCLQEIKCETDAFPGDRAAELGYEVAAHGEGRWNGVAILSRVGLDGITRHFPGQPAYEPPPDEDEPALWRKAYTDEIELWIEVGQPDETRIRKACGRSRQVVVISYGGNAAEIWWNKVGAALARNRNLTVLDIPAATVTELVALLQRGMRLQCLVQDGQLQLMNDADSVAVDPLRRMAPVETVS